jgi:hypothetical protein
MPVLTPQLLAIMDRVRGIPDALGLLPYKLAVMVRTWSGPRVGQGTPTNVTTLVTHQDMLGGPARNVQVRQLTRREIVASGGLYTDRDMKSGPITPSFVQTYLAPAGGYTDATLDPTPNGTPTEIFWRVQGPSLPAAGGWFAKIGEEATSMHYFVILRQLGRIP